MLNGSAVVTDPSMTSILNLKKITTTNTAPHSTVYQAYHVGLLVISALIGLSNIFAISIYCRHKALRKNLNNILLCSLAVSDLLTGLIYLPVLVIIERTNSHEEYKWLLTFQRYHFMFGNLCGFSTVFHIIALTIDKYIAVLHPFKKMNLTTRWYRKILVSLWTTALFFALIPLFWYFKDEGSQSWYKKFHIYGIFQLVIFFGLSLLTLIYCYLRMFAKIHNHDHEGSLTGRVQRRERTDRKTISVFLCFFVVFVIGWFPWFLFTLDNNMLHVPLEVKDFLVTLRFAGAFLNPAIYAFLKNDYRQAISSDLTKLCSKPAGTKMESIELKTTNHTARMTCRSHQLEPDHDKSNCDTATPSSRLCASYNLQ